MIYLFASDLHGSYSATEALLTRFQELGAHKLILLGDLLYHGPRNPLPDQYTPKKVSMLLNLYAKSIICLRGNCEAEVDQTMLEFPVLCESAWMYIEGVDFYLHHGHAPLPPLPAHTVIVSGHTHTPRLAQSDGHIWVNPGSVALPKNGYPPSYIIYSEKTFTLYTLDGKTELEKLRLSQ